MALHISHNANDLIPMCEAMEFVFDAMEMVCVAMDCVCGVCSSPYIPDNARNQVLAWSPYRHCHQYLCNQYLGTYVQKTIKQQKAGKSKRSRKFPQNPPLA